MRLSAINRSACAAGLHKSQTLSDARAVFPAIDCHDADEYADQKLLTAIADWCERYTPLLAIDVVSGLPGLMLDVTGCAHLFKGEEQLRTDIMTNLKAQGFGTNVAIAPTPGAAWGLARYGDPKAPRIIDANDIKEQVGNLPLEALRTDDKTVEELKRVGLQTIGCIMDMPRGPLALRYGKALLRRLDQALAREEETISPRMPVADLVSERQFVDPVSLEEDISRTILSLAGNLKPCLETRGLGARVLALKLFRVDGERRTLNVVTANPEREPANIEQLFKDRLSSLHHPLDAGFGFDLIRLEVCDAESMLNHQSDFIARTQAEDGFTTLINRLGARLGVDRVQRFAVNDTHIPERSFSAMPAIHIPRSNRKQTQAALAFSQADKLQASDSQLTRPILLLNHPEPLNVLAEVPEGAPRHFRWRKVLYEVKASEGPERISCEWWRDGRYALTRDYFKSEDSDGRRFWLFRQGLYERETNEPDWYMHGIFP